MDSKWVLKKADNDSVARLSGMLGIDEAVLRVIFSRCPGSITETIDYLYPCLADLHSPFLFKNMRQAVARLRSAVSGRERIAVFADSDLDGITSMTLIHNLLTRVGIKPECRYLKGDETYGLTREIIDEFIKQGIDLLITVDSGTRDVDEIAYASEAGIDVIVTDHHEPDRVLPEAIIINPKLQNCGYPFRHLAGAGVAFKLCHGFLLSYLPWYNTPCILVCRQEGMLTAILMRNGIEEGMITADSAEELAGTGFIPADGEFRIIYDADTVSAEGFFSCSCEPESLDEFSRAAGMISSGLGDCGINNEKHAEIYMKSMSAMELMKRRFSIIQSAASGKINDFINSVLEFVSIGTVADVVPLIGENRILVHEGMKCLEKSTHPGLSMVRGKGPVRSKTIGWDIAPLLNTPGRYGLTQMTAEFFLSQNYDETAGILSEIKKLNSERKITVNSICDAILADIGKGKFSACENMLFVSGEIHEGLVGLIANRISDKVRKPVIIASLPGRGGLVKGSGRCFSDYNFFSHVEKLSEKFDRVGGHPQAFGFTVRAEELDEVMGMVDASMNESAVSGHEYIIDAEVGIEEITGEYIRMLSLLEPFGNGNEEPLLIAKGVRLDGFKRFGTGKNHGRYAFQDNRTLSGIGWNMADTMECFHDKGPVDLIFNMENNAFNGNVYPRLIIQDMRFSE